MAQRGSFLELFTLYSNEQMASKMEFAAELFLDEKVKDDFNKEEILGHRRLRYELYISRRKDEKLGLERLYVDYEVLKPIKKGSDTWYKSFVKGEEWQPEKVSLKSPKMAYIHTG